MSHLSLRSMTRSWKMEGFMFLQSCISRNQSPNHSFSITANTARKSAILFWTVFQSTKNSTEGGECSVLFCTGSGSRPKKLRSGNPVVSQVPETIQREPFTVFLIKINLENGLCKKVSLTILLERRMLKKCCTESKKEEVSFKVYQCFLNLPPLTINSYDFFI